MLKKSLPSRRQTHTFGTKEHLWLLCHPRSSTVTEHLSTELPTSSPRGACLHPRLLVRQGYPLSMDWDLSQRRNQPPPTFTHLNCPYVQWVVGAGRGGHHSWNLPDPRNGRARGVWLPPFSPLAMQQKSKNQYSCCELAGLKVTAKMEHRGWSQSHHSHLDSCTDLEKTASASPLQGQRFSSTFGGLAGGPPWVLSQRWVFHLQLDSEQIPTIRNRVRARRPVFHHP